MTVSQDIAAVSTAKSWNPIDWKTAKKVVMKLQVRIAKATKQGRWNKVKSLQWLLTHSFYAKCLAVRTATTNRGKNVPGIDGVVLKENSQKLHGVGSNVDIPIRKGNGSTGNISDRLKESNGLLAALKRTKKLLYSLGHHPYLLFVTHK